MLKRCPPQPQEKFVKNFTLFRKALKSNETAKQSSRQAMREIVYVRPPSRATGGRQFHT
jgi:hypothetical protein